MELINGITFAPFPKRGVLGSDAVKKSLDALVARTGASHIILTPSGIQGTPHSEHIDFSSDRTPTDDELKSLIKYAQSIGLRVILKPTVNCKDGTWRAFINFFDKDVPCEPKWSAWFAFHEAFQLHYAKIAEETDCALFILGCEMVCTERRADEWRDLVAKTKRVFSGPVSYNTDKYQEECVSWWDCVDVISSSGYYPSGTWGAELDRIESVVTRFNKPFFFAETGCMSVAGASRVPNDWTLTQNDADTAEQAAWYREMFEHTSKRPWVGGYGLWAWGASLYAEADAASHKGYDFYGKSAESVVRGYFDRLIFS